MQDTQYAQQGPNDRRRNRTRKTGSQDMVELCQLVELAEPSSTSLGQQISYPSWYNQRQLEAAFRCGHPFFFPTMPQSGFPGYHSGAGEANSGTRDGEATKKRDVINWDSTSSERCQILLGCLVARIWQRLGAWVESGWRVGECGCRVHQKLANCNRGLYEAHR
ncbi:hypothetical protein VTK73DRAFT_3100 [Phialemonium thermophilum]|uniref:Uncharacterized protein n=1 Tax=Phialemonium thermophilum TaxID=223376 RepID=A0ABR3X0M6_9PEZI